MTFPDVSLPLRTSWVRIPLILCVLLLLDGCAATSNVAQTTRLEANAGQPKILLMPPDIQFQLLTAGSVAEPQAEWTRTGRENFQRSLESAAQKWGAELQAQPAAIEMTDEQLQYARLHAAVGSTILMNYFGPAKLPSKANTFDWSLGPDVRQMSQEADYALFTYYRDTRSSGGRKTLFVLAAAVGAQMQMGGQVGFASLVDLRTGDVVWFNQVSATTGDLRDSAGAVTVVDNLFKGFPAAK